MRQLFDTQKNTFNKFNDFVSHILCEFPHSIEKINVMASGKVIFSYGQIDSVKSLRIEMLHNSKIYEIYLREKNYNKIY